jgi:hypothetical protein
MIHSYIQTTQFNYDIQNGKINILMLIRRTNGTTEYIFVYNTLLNTHTFNLRIYFFLNKQQDALIIQIYSVLKLYIFRASLSIIRMEL